VITSSSCGEDVDPIFLFTRTLLTPETLIRGNPFSILPVVFSTPQANFLRAGLFPRGSFLPYLDSVPMCVRSIDRPSAIEVRMIPAPIVRPVFLTVRRISTTQASRLLAIPFHLFRRARGVSLSLTLAAFLALCLSQDPPHDLSLLNIECAVAV
jgi:hypothetical protein